jgi:hypothetical protein
LYYDTVYVGDPPNPSLNRGKLHTHIIDLQSFHRAKDESHLGTPGTEDAIKAAMAVIDNSADDVVRGHHLGDGLDVIEALLRVAFVPQADSPPPTPSVAPP